MPNLPTPPTYRPHEVDQHIQMLLDFIPEIERAKICSIPMWQQHAEMCEHHLEHLNLIRTHYHPQTGRLTPSPDGL